MANLTLTAWLHPSMELPFNIDFNKFPFSLPPSATVMELMERVESVVENMSQMNSQPLWIQIQMLWKVNSEKVLDPRDTLGTHFASGDTFGVCGEIQEIQPRPPPIPEGEKLPVTILTGFLGAGKTTLLNYILQEQTEKKVAVIENEFGSVSIDDALLKRDKLVMAEKIVVMDNGCICCTVRGDLQKGLEEILAEITEKGTKIDQIIIETTGMADPVPIVRTFMANPELTAMLRLDCVITVADAKHILGRLDDEVEEGKVNEAYQQVAFCDKILLNKLDLVTTDKAIEVKERLRSINAYAKILPAVKGRVRMDELVNIRAHDMANFVNADIEKEDEDNDEGDGSGLGNGQVDEHGNAIKQFRHDSRVNSLALVHEGEILPQKLGPWMQSLGTLPEDKGVIYRIKGILAIRGHPYKHVFHAVMDVSDEDDAEAWAPGEKKVTKMVFIGKGLDKEHIRKGFEGIFES